MKKSQFITMLITDNYRQAHLTEKIKKLPKNSLIIIRDYDHPNRKKYASELISIARRTRRKVLIAGDPRLARAIRADGIHLPEYMLKKPTLWKPFLKPNWHITAAAHSLPTIVRAKRMKIKMLLCSPVFFTESHPHARPLGAHKFAAWTQPFSISLIALGGINKKTIKRVRISKAAGVAGIGIFT